MVVDDPSHREAAEWLRSQPNLLHIVRAGEPMAVPGAAGWAFALSVQNGRKIPVIELSHEGAPCAVVWSKLRYAPTSPPGGIALSSPEPGRVRLFLLDPTRLMPLTDATYAHERFDGGERLVTETDTDAACIELDDDLPPGRHETTFPETFERVTEITLLYHPRTASFGLMFVRPSRGEVIVEIPKEGTFLEADGAHWPYRILRHPASGLLVGDGLEYRTFFMDAAGREIVAWE